MAAPLMSLLSAKKKGRLFWDLNSDLYTGSREEALETVASVKNLYREYSNRSPGLL